MYNILIYTYIHLYTYVYITIIYIQKNAYIYIIHIDIVEHPKFVRFSAQEFLVLQSFIAQVIAQLAQLRDAQLA